MSVVKEERTIDVYICDECGMKSELKMRKCFLCGKHYCSACIGKHRMLLMEVKETDYWQYIGLHMRRIAEVVACHKCREDDKVKMIIKWIENACR